MIYHNENDSYKFTRRPYHTGSNQRACKLTKFFVYILSPTQLYLNSAIYIMTLLLWNVLRLQVFPGLFRR